MRGRLVAAFAVACLSTLLLTSAASAAWIIRPSGLGPLKVGMTKKAAMATGWLGSKGRPVCPYDPYLGYRLAGPRTPRGLAGRVVFTVANRVMMIEASRGVVTELGIRPQYDTVADMERVYRANNQRIRVDGSYSVALMRTERRSSLQGATWNGARIDAIGVPSIFECF